MGILNVANNLHRAHCIDKKNIDHQVKTLATLYGYIQNIKSRGLFLQGKIIFQEGGELDTKIRGYIIGSTEYRYSSDLNKVAGPGKTSDIYIIILDQNNKERRINLKEIAHIEEYSLKSEWVEQLKEETRAKLDVLETEEMSATQT